MKKLLMTLLAVFMLVGCGGGEDKPDNNTGNANTKPQYYFEVNNTKVYMNQDFSEVYASLGQEQSKFTSPSCAFEGQEDNVYTYPSYQLTTYTKDGKEYVYSITLKDDTVLAHGAYLGQDKDSVIALIGKDYKDNNGAVTYEGKDGNLEFIFEDNSVSQISYTAIVE